MQPISRETIIENWLPRYTGMPLGEFGSCILVTNFFDYVRRFSQRYGGTIYGEGGPMQACTGPEGITIINYGIGSPNAATIMDLLSAIGPSAVLFLGKCGGLKDEVALGDFLLPIAAVRGDGTGLAYYPGEVPALPSFRLHAVVAEEIKSRQMEYWTGVIYTTNRRVWEWDRDFERYLRKIRVIGIDMETATLFLVGHHNNIPRGALLLVSDTPMVPEGIKTAESDRKVTSEFVDSHLDVGVAAMKSLLASGEQVKHLIY